MDISRNEIEPETTRKRILIVDDDPTLLISIEYMLKNKHNTTTALGGQSALDMLVHTEMQFDVIISDLSMPDVSGADLYHHVAKKYPGHEEYIIFMTGGTYTPLMQEFLASIDNPVLEKPFTKAEIWDAIDKVGLKPL